MKLWKITATTKNYDEDGRRLDDLTLELACPGETRGKARSAAVMFLQDNYDGDIEYTHRMSIKRTSYESVRNDADYWDECPICHHPATAVNCPHTEDERYTALEAAYHAQLEDDDDNPLPTN